MAEVYPWYIDPALIPHLNDPQAGIHIEGFRVEKLGNTPEERGLILEFLGAEAAIVGREEPESLVFVPVGGLVRLFGFYGEHDPTGRYASKLMDVVYHGGVGQAVGAYQTLGAARAAMLGEDRDDSSLEHRAFGRKALQTYLGSMVLMMAAKGAERAGQRLLPRTDETQWMYERLISAGAYTDDDDGDNLARLVDVTEDLARSTRVLPVVHPPGHLE